MTNRSKGDGHGRRLTAVVTTLLVTAGLTLLAVAALKQQRLPEPALSGSRTSSPSASWSSTQATRSSAQATPATTQTPTGSFTGLSRSAPVRIVIPAIGVSSAVDRVDLDKRGAIAVPQPGPHYDEAAWFTGSPSPGQVGPATVVGHVDSAKGGPSVFFRLGSLHQGNEVKLTRADGIDVSFTVYRAQRYHKDAFPTNAVYGNTATPELRLITCGGSFDAGAGHYTDNIVIYARLAP